jgi:hypothetical protein
MDTLFHGWDAVQRGRMVEDRDGAAVLAATVAAPMHRIEIIGERRLAHAAEFRAEMVAQSLVPGIRIQDLARRNGICASLILSLVARAAGLCRSGAVGSGSYCFGEPAGYRTHPIAANSASSLAQSGIDRDRTCWRYARAGR